MPDPIGEIAQVQTYIQSSAAWITAASALITQLEAASTGNPAPTDSDSPDVEAAIQGLLTFAGANPVPAVPTLPATPAPTPATGS